MLLTSIIVAFHYFFFHKLNVLSCLVLQYFSHTTLHIVYMLIFIQQSEGVDNLDNVKFKSQNKKRNLLKRAPYFLPFRVRILDATIFDISISSPRSQPASALSPLSKSFSKLNQTFDSLADFKE